MSSIVIRDVTKRLKELEAELGDRDRQLKEAQASYDHIAEKVENYRGMLADYSQWEGATAGQQLRSEDLHDTMFEILGCAQTPLHYKAIYDNLLDYGINVPGEDPVKNTGAHLSSDARFVSLGQGMWALADWESNSDDPVMVADDLPF